MTAPTVDHGLEAHKAAMEHLRACYEAMEHDACTPGQCEDGGGDCPPAPETMAPFCGCEDCVVREVLHAAWPHLERSVLSG